MHASHATGSPVQPDAPRPLAGVEVWWIRHGESVRNAGQRTFDTYNAPITPLGEAQALRAAAALPGPPDLLVRSTFLRTTQTAAPMLARFPATPVEIWDVHEHQMLCDVRTRDTTRHEREPMVREYWQRRDPDHVEGVGAESFRGFIARVDAAITRLCARTESWIVVCSHQHYMLGVMFRMRHPGAPVERDMMRDFQTWLCSHEVDNASMMRMRLDRGGQGGTVDAAIPVGEPWTRPCP